jgi:hypothetical protein
MDVDYDDDDDVVVVVVVVAECRIAQLVGHLRNSGSIPGKGKCSDHPRIQQTMRALSSGIQRVGRAATTT